MGFDFCHHPHIHAHTHTHLALFFIPQNDTKSTPPFSPSSHSLSFGHQIKKRHFFHSSTHTPYTRKERMKEKRNASTPSCARPTSDSPPHHSTPHSKRPLRLHSRLPRISPRIHPTPLVSHRHQIPSETKTPIPYPIQASAHTSPTPYPKPPPHRYLPTALSHSFSRYLTGVTYLYAGLSTI